LPEDSDSSNFSSDENAVDVKPKDSGINVQNDGGDGGDGGDK